MNPKKIGDMIRFHRKIAGISQEDLALQAGLGKTVIFDLEKGKMTVRLETLLKVLFALNIKLDFQSPLMDQFKESSHEKS